MAHVTDAEFAALIDNCTTTWTTRNGVYGRPLLVLHAAFGEFRLRVVPLLRFGLFQPVLLRPLLGSPGASSPRICQVARELRAHPIHREGAKILFVVGSSRAFIAAARVWLQTYR